MRNFPFRSAKSSDPKTLHMDNCSRIDNKPSVVTLSDGAQLVAEENRRWLLDCFSKYPQQKEKKCYQAINYCVLWQRRQSLTGVIVFLTETETGWFHARPIATTASASNRSGESELANIVAPRNLESAQKEKKSSKSRKKSEGTHICNQDGRR